MDEKHQKVNCAFKVLSVWIMAIQELSSLILLQQYKTLKLTANDLNIDGRKMIHFLLGFAFREEL